jgi:hypothetical protein
MAMFQPIHFESISPLPRRPRNRPNSIQRLLYASLPVAKATIVDHCADRLRHSRKITGIVASGREWVGSLGAEQFRDSNPKIC